MPRKPKVQRTAEEKWQIVLEGLKSGNVAETCRKYSNSRIDAKDRHRLDGQMVPNLGNMVVKLIGATGEVWFEQKWEWEEDLQHEVTCVSDNSAGSRWRVWRQATFD